MRVAFMVTTFPRLSETFVLSQITGLIDRGHEVDIFADRPSGEPKVHPDVERYQLQARTRYLNPAHSMPRNKLRRVREGLHFALRQLPRNARPLLQALNVAQHGKEAASLRLLYTVRPFLEAAPYDVVHCHFGPNGQRALFLKQLGALQGRLITSFHGHDVSAYIKKQGVDVYQKLFAQGDMFLPISERMRADLVRMGCCEQRTQVHRMGIDVRAFTLVPRTLDGGPVRLLSVARLVEKKGIEYAIRAVAQSAKRGVRLEYTIVGDGQLREPLARLIDELQASETIKLIGWRHQEEVAQLMRQAHLLLAPSVTAANGDQEGIPVVLMEALASGMPVLTTNHSGIPELVSENESGFLVPERDVEALAERLCYLIEHPERWAAMGQIGRRHVEEQFDTERLNDRLVELYQQLVQGGER